MWGFLNKVQLIGNLGQDPEARSTRDGKKVVTLSIATGESWKDKHSGERIERTEWHRVVIFNEGLADVADKFLLKGMKVYLEGKLVTNKWQDRDGNDRYTTEIQLQPYNGVLTILSPKKNGEKTSGDDAPARAPAMAGAGGPDLDDDIPF